MNKEFIPYEQALELKELGFDEPCLSYFSESQQLHLCRFENMSDRGFVSAPTYQQAFRWFREKYGLDNAIMKDKFVVETNEDLPEWYYGFKTYEEAELACLKKLIEITKNK
jgi:hypothetical protein